MVTFVVSLFSPNTVSFFPVPDESSSKSETSVDKGENVQDYCSRRVPAAQHARSQSLTSAPTFTDLQLVQTPRTIAQTPGATTQVETVFLPYGVLNTSKLSLPDRGMIRNKSTTSLQNLAALDAQTTLWGKSPDMNQPKSLAQSPPSQSIFNGSAATLKGPTDKDLVFAKPSETTKPHRPNQKKITYTTENYTVQATTLGNADLFAAIEAVSGEDDMLEKLWVGTMGMPTDALPEDVKAHITAKLENEFETLAVFIDDTDMNAHYENYCKEILWPHFHSQVPDVPKSKAYQDQSWSHYVKVNEAFAACVIKNYKNGDTVWVHDYHLLLVPELVRKKHPEAQIGLYVHAAFPPSEIFRNLPSRVDLVQGMLGSNLIAFQTEEFRYQFLQTCSRLLNIEATEHGLVLEDGRFIDVFNIPMGIDIDAMNVRRKLPEVKNHMKELSEKFAGKRLIVSRDKLNIVNGLKHKLRGYKYFLNHYPEWANQTVLVQITTSVSQDRDLKEEISDLITYINGEWGDLNHQPIVYLNKDIDYSQYVALLSIADCMLVTSLSEGMNLGCHEFVVCQDKSLSLKGHAPLVVSEFVGAAKVFGDNAVKVNPWHPKGMAEGLNKALTMGSEEQTQRWNKLYALTKKHDARTWYDSYILGLEHAWKEHATRDPSSVPRMQIRQLRQTYDSSEKRLLIVDFEGTLTTWDSPKETVVTVPLKVIEALSTLVEDPRNTVYVMSQYTMDGLAHMFRMIPKLGLIAENGAFLKKAGRGDWRQMAEFDTTIWREGIMKVLNDYTGTIEGSMVRELRSGIMLHYYDSEDQQDAAHKASELADQVNEVCEHLGVRATPFEKGIYIGPTCVNKALAMKVIEEGLFGKPNTVKPDFVFAIGDSYEDECVFKWAHSLRGRVQDHRVVTVMVGKRSTAASCALTQGTDAAVLTLEKLAMSVAANIA